jgi:phage terminase large subunit-like protein
MSDENTVKAPSHSLGRGLASAVSPRVDREAVATAREREFLAEHFPNQAIATPAQLPAQTETLRVPHSQPADQQPALVTAAWGQAISSSAHTSGARPILDDPVGELYPTPAEAARFLLERYDVPGLAEALEGFDERRGENRARKRFDGRTVEWIAEWLEHWPALHEPIGNWLRVAAGSQPAAPTRDPKYERAQRSLAAFCQLLMPRFKLRPVTRLIIAKLEEATRLVEAGQRARLVICVPPRVGKTRLVSRLFPAWFLGRNPHLSAITASHGRKLAASIGDDVLGYIKHPEYKKIFPQVALSGSSKSKTEFKLYSNGELGGEYGSYGRGGGYTGHGAHLLIIDDLLKEKEVDSEARLADAHGAVQALSSRLDPEDVTCWIVVNTRYRENDVVGYILSEYAGEGPWDVVAAPLIADSSLTGVMGVASHTAPAIAGAPSASGESESDPDGPNRPSEAVATIADHMLPPLELLDGSIQPATVWHRPDGDVMEPYTRDRALRRREVLLKTKPMEWWGQYQCHPVPAKGNMVDPSDFRVYLVDAVCLARASYARVGLSVDTGEGNTASGARSAIGVYGEMLPACNVCQVCKGKGGPGAAECECAGTGKGPAVRMLEVVAYPFQLPEQVAVIKALASRWRAEFVLIEAKSTGPGVAQQLRRDTDWVRCPVILIKVPGGQDKVTRMASALPSVRDRQYGLPADASAIPPSWKGLGYKPGEQWPQEFRNELLHFPRSKYKDRCDQFSQFANYRTLNPLVLPQHQGGQAPQSRGLAEQSARVSQKVAGGDFSAF